MKFHILTLFPEMVRQGLSASIIGRAADAGILSINTVNIRDYTTDKHKKVDDYPYGGGAGMLMQAQPVYDAWKSVAGHREAEKNPTEQKQIRTVYLTPQGKTFTQSMAQEFAKEDDLILLCGHYEGIDERVLEKIVTDYVSIGDYVLTGGELPAMVLVDAVARLVPGVLNNEMSAETESFHNDLLEYPQYSRPVEWHGKHVPAVLLSGNQRNIRAWRLEESKKRTKERRMDLYQTYELLQACREKLLKKKLLHIDMIELIARGQAKLLFAEGGNICLKDRETGMYFHTAETMEMGCRMFEFIIQDTKQEDETLKNGGTDFPRCLILHQAFMVELAKEVFGLKQMAEYHNGAYTRKEKLPVKGLYRQDGEKAKDNRANGSEGCLPEIRKLGMEFFAAMEELAKTNDSCLSENLGEIRMHIAKGHVFGAFVNGKLAGFAGIYPQGALGMLYVVSEYRSRGIGKALMTYLVNLSLELGHIPYVQVKTDDTVAVRLCESLGFYFSKESVYRCEQ